MQPSDDDIIFIAESGAVAAIREYENMSGTSLYFLPEYWITCRIASDLASHGLIVQCEKRFTELLPSQSVKGRIDLAVYAKTEEDLAKSSLRALIEVKGPRSNWPPFRRDWDRMKLTSETLNVSGLLIGIVYGTENKTHPHLNVDEDTMKLIFPAEKIRASQRQHLQDRHEGITPDVDDVWEIISVFDRV